MFLIPIATGRTSLCRARRFLKARNPNSVVRLKDLQTGRDVIDSSRGSSNGMALKLRPTGLGSGIDKDRPDYTVCCA